METHEERWERIRLTTTGKGSQFTLHSDDYVWLMKQAETFREMVQQFGEYNENEDDLSDFYHDFRSLWMEHQLNKEETK